MYSLNVPLPSAVGRLASSLARDLPRARARARGEHTLVCKRLGGGTYGRVESQVRECLRGTAPFEARIVGVDCFETAASGPSPVVYLTVDSPPLCTLHERLCDRFDPVEGMEGDDYVPHVTVARGGDPEAARRLVERDVDPVSWAVQEVVVYDADHDQPATRISLPA